MKFSDIMLLGLLPDGLPVFKHGYHRFCGVPASQAGATRLDFGREHGMILGMIGWVSRVFQAQFVAALLAKTVLSGCGGVPFPEEVSIENAPAVLRETFKDTKDQGIRTGVELVIRCIRGKNYTGADRALNSLMTQKLTQEQTGIVAAIVISVGEKLQQAIEEGDIGAAQHMQIKSLGK